MISCRIMKTSELDYDLPEALIAQRPAAARDQSRLLVVDRQTRNFREDVFGNIATYLRAGDCLAINNTRVIRARLFGHKDTGGRVEVLLDLDRDYVSYYRLSMEPSKIRINLDNFKNHYDFELREIADKLALRMVS